MDEVIATVAPEVVESAVDLTEVLEYLEQLVALNNSIYAFIAFAVIVGAGGLVCYFFLRPLFYFFR